MSNIISTTLFFLTEKNGIYKHVRSVNCDLNKLYEEFFHLISKRDLIQCIRMLRKIDDTHTFLNQLTFICDSKCCNTNCIALNLCHLAVLNDCKEILEELLRHGGDLSRKTVGVTISENQKYFLEKDSVIDLIIRRFNEPVEYFKDLFDKYIENSELGSSYEFKFDFSILCPSSGTKKDYPGKYDHQMCVLNQIVNSFNGVYSPECIFLQHPLIEVFLTCKWRHYRRFFYILVAMHVLFVVFLSATATLIVRNYEKLSEIQETVATNTYLDVEIAQILPLLKTLNILLVFVGFQLFCHAIIQACFIPLRKLIYEFEILSNLLTSTFALINCIYGFIQPLIWQLKNQFQLIYSLNSLIILPAWINLMLIIGRIPSLGCYSLMFTTVLKNFLKVMMSFIFLIVGFAMSFSLIFPMSEYFNSPLRAILRTTVMMMGEFEYSQMFSQNTAGTSKFIFVLFVVSCSIILMNLTQGIAVKDIQILHEISQTIRLEKETRFLYEFEAIFTQKIMTSNRILRKIKNRLYDSGAIDTILTISKKNRRHIISNDLFSKLIQRYKPTKTIWSRKLSYPKFYFKCLPNRFDVL
ncbi:transient receptor potential channel pyrexia-like [Episyrphus balteatus]|uniref:transient receptor potential channel pyrexia-like n=1 Tax=Episyrphus balteatus TaxID=286459 RepID=UPI002486963F|nr:transient receptor potential channel pyrexia-like [Episyrphus balteatus]